MDTKIISKRIQNEIEEAENVLLISHQNPDSDAFGSLAAFSKYLDSIKKKHTLFCKDAELKNFLYLPNIERIHGRAEILPKEKLDLLIAFDTSDLHYAGIHEYVQSLSDTPTIVNIDHHHTNNLFGHINLVRPSAASTTEIIYQFFKDLKIFFNHEIALSLLTGIIGDTNSFSNHNTTTQTLRTASKLLVSGARIQSIIESIYKNKSLQNLQLWGKAFERLELNNTYNIGYTVLTREDLSGLKTSSDAGDGISNYLNNLSNVNFIMVLREVEDGVIKGSMRTNSDAIDVSKLAKTLGGGGHRKAAGFQINGKLIQTEQGWKVV